MFGKTTPEEKIEALYAKYLDTKTPTHITLSGVKRLLDDLKISNNNRLVLILAWQLNASAQGEFTKNEFCMGLASLGADTITTLKKRLKEVNDELCNATKFRDFYKFTYNYAKDPSQKALEYELAIVYWQILLPDRFTYLDDWCHFLMTEHKKSIHRDVWNMLLEFIEQISVQFNDYDADAAWPVLIDDFVAWQKARM